MSGPHKEDSNLLLGSQGDTEVSPSGDLLLMACPPGKWLKCERFYAFWTLRCIPRGRTEAHSWNVRGLGSRNKRRMVKDFLRSENPDVVMIQETKKEKCDRRFVGSVWTVRNKDWVALPASGHQSLKKRGARGINFEGEIHWRQKVRVKWVKEGDCNSKFYHKVANGRRNRKYIKELENEMGLVLKNAESITEEILLYFEKLYTSPTGEFWGVEGLDWSPISEESTLSGREKTIRGGRRVFKIDFEKAYDHVKWDFFGSCVREEGFSPRWRKWMSGCLSSVSYAILVNGSAKGWVKASRGLRQGDPLSHFLFTLVADVLSRMLRRARKEIWRKSCRLSRVFVSVWAHFWAQGVRLAYTLSGSPLGGNPKACGFWDPVIERISSRLDGWQKAYLSIGGRITLIQSCLTHLPCYFLSLFKLPASVAAKIERLQRDFLWSGIGEGKRDHLVRWDVVCKSKAIRGLGFGNISLRNLALLGKWLWSQMVTLLSLEGYCTSLSGVFLVYSMPDSGHYPLQGFFSQILLSSIFSNFWISSELLFKVRLEFSSSFQSEVLCLVSGTQEVNTNDMLQVRRPYKALSPDICILCMKHEESADHLFLHCSLTIGLWHRLFQLVKMDWVPPRTYLT
ncbi:putative ribonuclease H protein [Vitis vinifera]|uniref:Putative ribonuclease H protein n=1 Tax=Vitis vinifera TaxID=29760 RepID=A0A438CNX4_VITVI|nr:putative ribonuclease H protein [Vitis vinifera]